LDSLGAAEQAALLEELLAIHPDLVAEAERRAGAMLETASRSDTAAEVVDALQALELEDMAVRAGYQPGRGYVHEVEAAGELVEKALEPFLADVRRRVELGMTAAAHEVALGVLAGLRECDRGRGADGVLEYAGEMSGYAVEVFAVLAALKAPLPDGAVDEICPDRLPHRR
jgi:hypothetical protein